jgi:putative transposase
MKLVFAVLARAAQHWSRVPMSELERTQLALLRQELGIGPPPGREWKEVGDRTAAA